MLRELMEAAGAAHPEMDSGRATRPSAGEEDKEHSLRRYGRYRALYGVDVMLDSHFQPKLLEVGACVPLDLQESDPLPTNSSFSRAECPWKLAAVT